MFPTYPDGTRLLSMRWPKAWLAKSQCVVVRAERDMYIVKRIGALLDEHHLELSSDNPAAQSPYCQTPIRRVRVVGIVLASLWSH